MKDHPFPFLMKKIFGPEIDLDHIHRNEEESSKCELCMEKKRVAEILAEKRIKRLLKRHPEIM